MPIYENLSLNLVTKWHKCLVGFIYALKMIMKWHWGSDSAHYIQVSQYTELLMFAIVRLETSWNGRMFSHNIGEILCMVISGLLRYRALYISKVLLRIWSWNGHSLVTLGKSLHMDCSCLWETELFELVEVHLGV